MKAQILQVLITYSYQEPGKQERTVGRAFAPTWEKAVKKAGDMRDRMRREGYQDPRTGVRGGPSEKRERTRDPRVSDFTGKSRSTTIGSQVKPDWLFHPEDAKDPEEGSR